MTREEILEVIKQETVDILYNLDPELITIDESLVNLGANSIDRAEIVMACCECTNIKLTAKELEAVTDIRKLVEAIYNKVSN